MALTALRFFFLFILSISAVRSSTAAPSLCSRLGPAFVVDGLRQQCPSWVELSPPIEASGETIDFVLGHAQGSTYYSVIFYASWCPFSRNFRPTFDALSSMFPQISHLALEESSAMPSVLSRYGVRSFPAILVANRTVRVLYHGPKDLNSLVHFYKEITGLHPVAYVAVEQSRSSGDVRPLRPMDQSLRDIISNERYLVFGVLFVLVKALLTLFPRIFYHLKAFWVLYAWHYLDFVIFGESSQLLERVLHVIDVKRLWSKLKLCNKARNLQKGANNARVWASSLASVSLGESSSRSVSADL